MHYIYLTPSDGLLDRINPSGSDYVLHSKTGDNVFGYIYHVLQDCTPCIDIPSPKLNRLNTEWHARLQVIWNVIKYICPKRGIWVELEGEMLPRYSSTYVLETLHV